VIKNPNNFIEFLKTAFPEAICSFNEDESRLLITFKELEGIVDMENVTFVKHKAKLDKLINDWNGCQDDQSHPG
jgi:hypothetical protein